MSVEFTAPWGGSRRVGHLVLAALLAGGCDPDPVQDTARDTEAPAEDARVLLSVGDSITWRLGVSPVYTQHLPDLLPPHRTVGSVSTDWGRVEGHGGYTTTETLAEIDAWATTYEEPPTDCLVLLGTNDIGEHSPAADVVLRLLELEQRLVELHGCRVHTGTPPTSTGPYAWLTAPAEELHVALVDSSLDHVVELSWDPTLHTLPEDGLHANDAGALLMAEQWAAALR